MDVTVCIGTFGSVDWVDLAQRAIRSAEPQALVIHRHGTSLAQARNEALGLVQTDWVVFLDADDELEAGYIEALSAGTADIRVPSVSYVQGMRARPAYVPVVPGHVHECSADCIEQGNYAVVGSMARTELVRGVGGFREEPLYEDWSLWLRMVRAGASMETIPAAVYRAHVRPDSRNRGPSMDVKNAIHRQIVAAA